MSFYDREYSVSSVVHKANPFHGADGRFSSKGKAKSISTGPAFKKRGKTLGDKAKGVKEAETIAKKSKFKQQKFTTKTFRADLSPESKALGQESKGGWAKTTTGQKAAMFNHSIAPEALDKPLIAQSRNGTKISKGNAAKIKQMDEGINSNELSRDMVLFRTANLKKLGLDAGKGVSLNEDTSISDLKKLVGQEFRDPSYGSSTLLPEGLEPTSDSGNTVSLEIRAPKGSSGVYLGRKERSLDAFDQEVLLPRDSHYKIVGAKVSKVPTGKKTFTEVNTLVIELVNGRKVSR